MQFAGDYDQQRCVPPGAAGRHVRLIRVGSFSSAAHRRQDRKARIRVVSRSRRSAPIVFLLILY